MGLDVEGTWSVSLPIQPDYFFQKSQFTLKKLPTQEFNTNLVA